MPGLTFYDAYFPTFINVLNSLEAILTKAQTHAKEKGIDFNAEYAPAKLAEDMLPLTFQVQCTSNVMKKAVNRLTGAAAEEWKDEEKTYDELIARVKKTLDMVKAVKPEDINGKEATEFEIQLGPNNTTATGQRFISGFVLPNAFFHLKATYSILRYKGVPLGKMDYLSSFWQW